MKIINEKYALLACCLLLCSCSGLEPESKINAAIPLSEEAQLALLLVMKQADSDQQDQIQKDHATVLKLRALTCAKGYSPSWFTSEDEIKKNLVDHSCFNDEDKKIANSLRIRRAGLTLAKAALGSEKQAAATTTFIADNYIEDVSFSTAAPIAMIKTRNGLNITDLYSGQILSKQNNFTGQMGLPSPNGRLYTFGNNAETKIFDSETSEQVGVFSGVGVQDFFWLDDRLAIYFERNTQNEKKAVLLDFATGNTSPIDGLGTNIIQAYPDADKPGEYFVVLNQSIVRIAVSHEGPAKIAIKQATPLSSTWWDRRVGITSDGKNIFHSSQDLELVSTANMQLSKLELKPFQASAIIATPDPDVILLSGRTIGSTHDKYLLSISKKTIAPVDDQAAPMSGRVLYIPFIRKNALISESRLILIDKIAGGAPQPLNQFIGEMALAQSEYKLKLFEQQQTTLRQMQGTSLQRSAYASAYPSPYESQAYAQARPEWEDADSYRDATVQAVGVYQGKKAGDSKSKPFIQVRVRPSSKPIVLVLSSYQAVRWVLIPERGARIGVVLISGYESSDVIGAGQARTIKFGSNYAYERNSSEYARLDEKVQKFLGRRIGTFQGLYEGENFSVGGNY